MASPGPKWTCSTYATAWLTGESIEEVAGFLCRADTVEEVKRKAEELGLL
jgi:hypothetical protein